jgi:hypothetical protein
VPARADGTLGLGEVLAAVHSPWQLAAEIKRELDTAGLAASQVVCLGARHGSHWTFLGGARAAPYRCRFGGRELTIEADRTYLDAAGRSIRDLDAAVREKATAFRESNVRWEWTGTAGMPSRPDLRRPLNR